MNKTKSPLKAIRQQCIFCMNDQAREGNKCNAGPDFNIYNFIFLGD